MLHKTSKIVENFALKLFESYIVSNDSKILDIGSGNGFFLKQLKENGYKNCQGADIEDYQISNAAIADINYQKLSFENDYFNAITAWELMEHLENPYFAIKEIHRILKAGGIFMFSMPNAFHWSNRLYFLFTGNFLRWNKKNDHRTIFTRDVFKKTIAPYFTLVDIHYCQSEFWQAKFQGILRRFNKLFAGYLNRYFPENQFFSRFIVYVLRKKV